jgi:hypothetical protein
MVLVLTIHDFGKAIFQTSKIHILFIQHPIIHILVHWNPLENGEKIHNFFCHFNNSK